MAGSIPPSQDKKRLQKCNFSRGDCLNTEESWKKVYHHKFKALKYNHKWKEEKVWTMDWDNWEDPANWELPLGPQMKSKKNGTKENLCNKTAENVFF